MFYHINPEKEVFFKPVQDEPQWKFTPSGFIDQTYFPAMWVYEDPIKNFMIEISDGKTRFFKKTKKGMYIETNTENMDRKLLTDDLITQINTLQKDI